MIIEDALVKATAVYIQKGLIPEEEVQKVVLWGTAGYLLGRRSGANQGQAAAVVSELASEGVSVRQGMGKIKIQTPSGYKNGEVVGAMNDPEGMQKVVEWWSKESAKPSDQRDKETSDRNRAAAREVTARRHRREANRGTGFQDRAASSLSSWWNKEPRIPRGRGGGRWTNR